MRFLHLDTNALIYLLDPNGPVFAKTREQCEQGVLPAASAVAWHEFVRGPLKTDELLLVERVLGGRIHPLDRSIAETAARLFNATGRRRASTADCLIAAAAIERDAELITANLDDFKPFVPMGLNLGRY